MKTMMMGEDFNKSVALLTKNFGKSIKKLNKQIKGTSQSRKAHTKSFNFSKFSRNTDENMVGKFKSKGIECKECGGFGHIQAECTNTKKKNLPYIMTWSEDEYEDDREAENNVKEHLTLINLTKNTVVWTSNSRCS